MKKHKLKKKGVVEIQIHWVLVSIIGTIILIFFISLAVKQQGIAKQHQINDMTNVLDNYITGSQSTPRIATFLSKQFPYEIGYECPSCNCRFVIKGRTHSLKSNVVFSTDSIDKDEQNLIVWTLPWNLPYHITNFLYMTAPGVRYVFVYDQDKSPLLDPFYTDFVSDKINKQRILLTGPEIQIEDQNNYRNKIIVIGALDKSGGNLPIPPKFAQSTDTSIIYIPYLDPSNERAVGEIQFFEYNKKQKSFQLTGKTSYIGLASLVGAIFSDNLNNYECGMKTAFKNYHAINQIFHEKVKLLNQSKVCSAFYTKQDLHVFERINQSSSNTVNWKNEIGNLISAANDLDYQNQALETQSCPLIY